MTTNTHTPSREEMISAIYEKIARKDLSFGCRIAVKTRYRDEDDFVVEKVFGWVMSRYVGFNNDRHIKKIIWHPVMIGDVMDFIERNFPDWIHCIECKKWKILSDNFNDDTIFYCDNEDCEFLSKFYWDEAFCHNMELYDWFWEEKRKPIEEQSDECIEFIYDLISE